MRTLFQSDGKIAVPAEAVKELSLRAAMPMLVIVEDNRLVLQPLNEAYFASLRGTLSGEDFNEKTIREDKLTQRAFEEQKLYRISSLHP